MNGEIVDIIVVGGGIGGVYIAAEAGRRGLKTVLITPNVFLGDEITATVTPWIVENDGCEKVYSAMHFKREMLELLEKNGVTVLFCSQVAGVLKDDGGARGIALANKYGIQVLYARAIIDATPNMAVLGALNEPPQRKQCGTGTLVISFENLTHIPDGFRPKVRRQADNGLTYIAFENISTEADINEVGLNLLCDLMKKPEFKSAIPVQMSLALFGESEFEEHHSLSCQNVCGIVPAVTYPFSAEILNKNAIWAAKLLDKVQFIDKGHGEVKLLNKNISIPLSECALSDFEDDGMCIPLKRLEFDYDKYLPVIMQTDVAIAGGGTAGVAAALGVRTRGVQTVVAEANIIPGGTQTAGLVSGYYHGNVEGFAALSQAEMVHCGIGTSSVARRLWSAQAIKESGALLLPRTFVCGATTQKGKVTGLVVAGDDGLGVISAKTVVDCTGDGDITAFCKVPTVMGAIDDGNMQNSSFWGVGASRTVTGDLGVFDQTVWSDLLQGISIGHKQQGMEDLALQFTAREGRQFDGEYCITMQDVLTNKTYTDCIGIAITDCDPHGGMSSTYSMMGFTPYHGEVYRLQTPYRACIPKNVRGLLLASKSISAEQDSAAYYRMAADVQNRGYAIGVAAGMAAEEGIDVRDIDVSRLQKQLICAQLMPQSVLAERQQIKLPQSVAERLFDGDESALKEVLCINKEDILPFLKKEWQKNGDSLNGAIALAWFGIKDGVKKLSESLCDLLDKEPVYDDVHPTAKGNNCGGIFGETNDYWKINQILTVMGMLGDEYCVPAVVKAAESASSGGSPLRETSEYIKKRFDLHRIPHYDRIKCLCFCIEHMPDARFIKPLLQLLQKPYMSGYTGSSSADFQKAYVELLVTKALAKCGSKEGVDRLKIFAKDSRGVLRRSAKCELKKIKVIKFKKKGAYHKMKNKKGITKRILSLLVVINMLLGMVAVYADGETAKQYGVLFSQDFNGTYEHSTTVNNTYYDIFGNMRGSTYVGNTIRISEVDCSSVPGLGAHSLALHDNKNTRVWKQWDERTYVYSGSGSTYSFEQEGANTVVCTEFDMYVHSNSLNPGFVQLMDGNVYASSTQAEYNKKVLLDLKFDPATQKLSYSTIKDNYAYTELGTFSFDTWQRYRIVQKVTDNEKALGTFDLYIDGVKVLSDIEYVKSGSTYYEYAYDMLMFKTYNTADTNSANLAYTFDNINVYKYSDSDTAADKVVAAPDTGALISALRKHKNTVSMLDYATSSEPSKTELEAKLDEALGIYDEITGIGNFTAGDPGFGYQEVVDAVITELETAFDSLTVTYKTGGEQLSQEGSDLFGTGEETDTTYKIDEAQYLGNGSTGVLGGGKYVIDKNQAATTIEGISLSTDETSDDYYKKEGPDAALVFDFDFKSKDLVTNARPAYVVFDNRNSKLNTSTNSFTTGFGIEFNGADKQIKFTGSDSVYENFADGEWYRIRYVIYITDENGDFAGKYDAWVNGTKVVSEGTISTDNLTKIDCMIVKDFTSTRTSNYSTVYYDNLRVYKSNVSAPMPVNDGQLLSAIRAAETECAAMEDATLKEKYAAAIASAKTAFEASDRTEEDLAEAYANLIDWNKEDEEPDVPDDTENKPIYTIDGFVLKGAADADGNREDVDTIVAGGQISKIKVTKNKEWASNSVLVLAFYGSTGKLISFRTYEVPADLAVGEQSLINIGRSLPSTNIEAYTFKAFIWDGITSCVPQAEAYTYTETVALTAVPLYESISVYVEQSVPVEQCEVYYKKISDASWSQAYSAEYNHREGNYSTSIVDLEEDTDYEISVKLYDDGEFKAIGNTTASTMSSNPPIAQEISIKDIYTPSTMLDLTDYCGSPDGWIKIKGDGETVIDVGEYYAGKTDYLQSVLCDNTHYVILEDLIISGGLRYGVRIEDSCSNIRLIGCDISGWGELGTLKETSESTAENVKVAYFSQIPGKESVQVRGAAVYAYCDDLTIERCFIHDGKAKVNPWSGTDAETGLTWTNSHPEGPSGIVVNGSRVVVRYNDIVGSEHFRLNDCIASGNNFGMGGFTADCDIYGNMFSLSNDDAVELDGNAKNVRFHHNRLFAAYTGISTIENYTGPSFVFNNVLHDLRDTSNIAFYHTKNAIENVDGDADTTRFGVTHFFYNTFYTNKGESLTGIYSVGSGERPYHAITGNNIVLGGQSSKDQIRNFADENSKSSFDYDLVGNYGTTDGKGIINLPESYTNGREENAILGLPTFVNKDGRDFRLTEDSLGYNSASKVDGFKGQSMGALDVESNGLTPARPLDMTLSASFIELKQAGSSAFSLTSNAEESMEFNIVMNEKNSPFTVTCEKSSIAPGETLTFTVAADESVALNGGYYGSNYYYDGIAFIKFSNGHSLPVCLRIKE